MDVARMPEPGATEGSSRQDLLRSMSKRRRSRSAPMSFGSSLARTPQKPSNSLRGRSLR